jgi:hypothetical protein
MLKLSARSRFRIAGHPPRTEQATPCKRIFELFQLTDRQMEAIYEYLRAIPCLEGSPDPNSVLHNDCGDPKSGSQNRASDARRKAKP